MTKKTNKTKEIDKGMLETFDDDLDPDAQLLKREDQLPSQRELVDRVAELEAQLTDQKLRLHAEMENTRRRAKLDVQEAHKYGVKKLVNALLPVIDTLERSLETPVESDALAGKIHEGVDMTLKLFISSLASFEVEVVNPLGETFNPEYHEVVQTLADPETEPGKVLKVLQKGYLLNGRLLRAAIVVVSS